MAVVLPSNCSRSTLQYTPPDPLQTRHRSSLYFASRRTASGRVHINPLSERHSDSNLNKSVDGQAPFAQIFTDKLALSRQTAKRLLRSVISQNSDSSSQDRAARARKRHSLPPPRPSVPLREAQSDSTGMRRLSRLQADGPAATQNRPRLSSDMRSQSPNLAGPPSQPNNEPTMAKRSSSDDNISSGTTEDQRPVAFGNGVSVTINLAEPVLFLQGFENTDSAASNTAMLRGNLHIRVQKSAKIKAINLKFKGRALTRWPEGIPPRKIEFEETKTIMNHTWPFFNAQFDSAESSTGADHVSLYKPSEIATSSVTRLDGLGRSSPNNSSLNLTSREAKRMSLPVNGSRSFSRDDMSRGTPVATKGYRTFHPGDYVYDFELPLDSRIPETIDVELGNVKYELEATIERSGAFRANLAGSKEVILIRAPAEGSLEQVEPIAISRTWEDQLHYDIVISGKSFPLGSQVPIAFKLTPLAKVQCHRIKVLITENIEYFCSNKHVHRMEPPRKVQLFEKRSDCDPTSTFPGSTMRITAGGGIPYDARARAARGESVVPTDAANLLGALESDTNIGPTEMEFNVQLPSCHAMKDRDRHQRLHFDTTYSNIQVHHWIKIVMRLSRPDGIDPTKRRHFEISIDSPFHILSCQATQANISLPAYTFPEQAGSNAHLFKCGCPGAAKRRNSPVNLSSSFTRAGSSQQDEMANTAATSNNGPPLARPQAAHIAGPNSRTIERPMHLLRAPSYNPPAFDDETPPPALITPPPQYDTIASPTNGLADYFARLSDTYEEDEHDDAHRDGRVNIPLTPGARVNRSMDIGRTWLAAAR